MKDESEELYETPEESAKTQLDLNFQFQLRPTRVSLRFRTKYYVKPALNRDYNFGNYNFDNSGV